MLKIYMTANIFLILGYFLNCRFNRRLLSRMLVVQGELLEYQLNSKNQILDPVDFVMSSHDMSGIFINPSVKYKYTYGNETYHGANLSVLGSAGMNTLNSYLGPKPKPVNIYLDPQNPKKSTPGLGLFKNRNVPLYFTFVAALFGFLAHMNS